MQIGSPLTGAAASGADTGGIKPEDPTKFYERTGYSPYGKQELAERFYFGDEHPKAWSMSAAAVAAARPD